MNQYIQCAYARKTAYFPRLSTDKLFKNSYGTFECNGPFSKYITLIKDKHLLCAETWRKFVDEFRLKNDSVDRAWRGEYWGKMMRGGVFTYLSTSDESLYDVLCETVRDMLDAQNSDGSFTTYDGESKFSGWDMWSRKYVMLGFEYFLEICRDMELYEKTVKALVMHADNILENVGAEEGKLGIFQTSQNWMGVNSASIIEPFVRLYNITEEGKYLDFAKYIVELGGSSAGNIFELAYKNEISLCDYPVRKAYEMMSCFEGLLEYYRATGEEKYKTAVLNFAHRVMEEEITVIGCAGTWHEIFDNSAKYQLNYEHTGIMQETCVTVTWMKICYQLLCLTGDIRFADYFELAAYNAMAGSVNTDEVTEYLSAFPFDSYNPILYGARARCSSGHNVLGKDMDFEYGCCASIGSAGLGLIPLMSVLTSECGFYFNMYIPERVSAYTPKNNKIIFSVKTDFPKGGHTEICIDGDFEETMSINLRIPSYCRNAILKVNGEALASEKGTYSEIHRKWKSGDKIELDFDTPVRTFRCIGPKDYGDYHIALFKGPVALARDSRLGEEIDGIVDIAENPDGSVDALEIFEGPFSTNLLYKIPMKDGSFITLADYASTGKTWDGNSVITVWMATKRYWSVDLTKPLYIQSINYADITYMTDTDGRVWWQQPERNKAYRWRLVPEGDYYRIKAYDGRFVTAVFDGDECEIRLLEYLCSDNQLWEIRHQVQDKYYIVSKSTGCHLHEIRWDYKLYTYRLFAFDKDADKRFSVRSIISRQSSKSVNECIFKFSND